MQQMKKLFLVDHYKLSITENLNAAIVGPKLKKEN